jgi:hypothetical protein
VASKPSLWGFKKLSSKPYPVAGAAISSPQGQVTFDLKDFLQTETISRIMLHIKGNVNVVAPGAGTNGVATGRDNPESLIVNVTARHSPALGVVSKNSLTPRGIIQQSIFDRGYGIHSVALTDPTVAQGSTPQAVDFWLPLNFKMPGSVNPIEWGLPLALFTSYQLVITCGGREQLFGGGTNTYDPTGLVVEVWADFDAGVAGAFHLVEEFEQVVPVVQTQADLQVMLERGFTYTHLLFIAQTANAKDDTLISGITVQSAGRVWTPQGDKNASMIRAWNRETHVNNAAENLTGTYFIPALRDGLASRGIEATQDRVEIKLDVTLGAGPSNVIVRGRRIQQQALQVKPASAVAA